MSNQYFDIQNASMDALMEACHEEYPQLRSDNLADYFENLPSQRTAWDGGLDVQRGDVLVRRQYGHHEPAWYGVVEWVEGNRAQVHTLRGRKTVSLTKDGQRMDKELKRVRPQYSRVNTVDKSVDTAVQTLDDLDTEGVLNYGEDSNTVPYSSPQIAYHEGLQNLFVKYTVDPPNSRSFKVEFINSTHDDVALIIHARNERTLRLDTNSPKFGDSVIIPKGQTVLLYSGVGNTGATANDFALKHTSLTQGKQSFSNHSSYHYKLPFKAGTPVLCTGGKGDGHHINAGLNSVDLRIPRGSKIFAAMDGVVVDIVQKFSDRPIGSVGALGTENFVRIKHTDDTYGVYAHLSQGQVKVKVGDVINQGSYIGLSGNSGQTSGDHLHFAVEIATRSGWKTVDWQFYDVNQKPYFPVKGKMYELYSGQVSGQVSAGNRTSDMVMGEDETDYGKLTYRKDNKNAYVQKHAPLVVKVCEATGLFPSVMMAQLIVESDWGKESLVEYNNYFGIKEGINWTGATVTLNTPGDKIKRSTFRVYDTIEEGFKDRVKFLQNNSRYKKNGVFDAKTPEEQINALQKAGYSESPLYEKTLNDIIRSNKLKQLDAPKQSEPQMQPTKSVDLPQNQTGDFILLKMPSKDSVSFSEATETTLKARILWPALGFPAVIAPRTQHSDSPFMDSDATRCICILILSNKEFLSKEEVVAHLRYVPWDGRGRRHIPFGEIGSFKNFDLSVRNDSPFPKGGFPKLTVPGDNVKDKYAQMIFFGGDKEGNNSISVTLSNYVREFYSKNGLTFLHEIRVSEKVSAQLTDGRYQLFWNNEQATEKSPSDELSLLLNNFAKPRREKQIADLGEMEESDKEKWRGYFQREYEYEYSLGHIPYKSLLRTRQPRTEVLHPLFVQRKPAEAVKIGHITDLHVCVRADAYEKNIKDLGIGTKEYNNWNKSVTAIYEDAKKDCDVLLLTGDLIDYGRGHLGQEVSDRLGEDSLYHVDRNWFLFYDLLAGGDHYQKPTYTILGNHDWRLNPYPPFAVGAPNPLALFHDKNSPEERKEMTKILQQAHGQGADRKYSYVMNAGSIGALLQERPGEALKTLARLIGQTKTMDEPQSPAETTIESIKWYLLTINPFFDYAFALPGGQRGLMLDWVEDEDLLFPIIEGGKEWPYMVWQATKATEAGPKARNSISSIQKHLIENFIRGTGQAKFIGIHTPLIGPYPDWTDADLALGRKIYKDGETPRGATNWGTLKSDGTQVKWNGHPLFAIKPKSGASGMDADYGSMSKNREWFIKALASQNAGVRLVFSGHIHRNGLYLVYKPTQATFMNVIDPKKSAIAGEWLIRGMSEEKMRALSAAYPAIVNMPEGQQGGPLYVNTTSAGPRGHIYKNEREKKYISPGYSAIELLNNGTIQNLTFRFPRDKPKTAAAVLKTTDIPKPKEPDKPMESVNASFLGEEWINLDERLQVPQDNIVVEAYLSDIPFAK